MSEKFSAGRLLVRKPAERRESSDRESGSSQVHRGQPLSASDRAFFQPRLGHDLGAVRIHADADARAFSRGLGARAVTVGTDIFCRDGKPAADNVQGRELLAHELAHVAQHRGHGSATVLTIDEPHSPAEREANTAATVVARGGAVRGLSALATPVVSRFTDERADVEEVTRKSPVVTPELTDADVRAMPASEKFVQAITRANYLEALGERAQELLTPESIYMMSAFLGATVFLQWTPAGWLADVVLAGVVVASVIIVGEEASIVIEELMAFCDKAANANSVPDLDEAGKHFATAVTKVGIDIVLGLLLHGTAKLTAPAKAPPLGAPAQIVTREGTTSKSSTTTERPLTSESSTTTERTITSEPTITAEPTITSEPGITGRQARAELQEQQSRLTAEDVEADLFESGLRERPEFQRPAGSAEIIMPDSLLAKADATFQVLMEHVTQAEVRFDAEGFTVKQTQAIEAAKPEAKDGLRALFYGERIDTMVKQSIQGDLRLDHLGVSEIKQPGPDFFDPTLDTWYDITTPRSWAAHVKKYGTSGLGVLVPHGGR